LAEAAVLSCSLLSDDILESINLLLLDGTTLVEFNGIPGYVAEVFAAGIDDELLLVPLVYNDPALALPCVPLIGLIVFKWSLRL